MRSSEVILLGSRAAGDHRPDSDVDLMAVCSDEAAVRERTRPTDNSLTGSTKRPS